MNVMVSAVYEFFDENNLLHTSHCKRLLTFEICVLPSCWIYSSCDECRRLVLFAGSSIAGHEPVCSLALNTETVSKSECLCGNQVTMQCDYWDVNEPAFTCHMLCTISAVIHTTSGFDDRVEFCQAFKKTILAIYIIEVIKSTPLEEGFMIWMRSVVSDKC